ncbi:hypothetical protein IFR05_011463 [Cadophora sp. M221]|nr:hypothetical protein IFR05_011463 [Cadophora sp. M221]
MLENKLPTGDLQKSRRSDGRHTSKKEKKEVPDFSDPTALVTFLVGADSTKFMIHKEVVCLHSDVLGTAFNSEFTEGQTQTYRLEDTSESAFRLFMQWLYCQRLPIIQVLSHLDPEILSQEWTLDKTLIDLWVLADKFLIPRLQNLVIETMQRKVESSHLVPAYTFKYLYENTAEHSLLRRYIIGLCVVSAYPSVYAEHMNIFPHDMLVDIAVKLASREQGFVWPELVVEDFHANTDIG